MSRLRQNKRPGVNLEIDGDDIVKIRRIASGTGAIWFVYAGVISGVGDAHIHIPSERSGNSAPKIVAVVCRDAGDA